MGLISGSLNNYYAPGAPSGPVAGMPLMLLAVEEASSTSHSSFVAREEQRSDWTLAESSKSESVRAADGGLQIMRARSW